MNLTAIASAGLGLSLQRFDQSAQRVARLGTEADLPFEAVEQIQAAATFSANLSVLKSADQMMGRLLDIKV